MIGDFQRFQDISQELSVSINQPSALPERTTEYIAEMCPLASSQQVYVDEFQGVDVIITACYLITLFVLLDSLSLGVVDSQRRGSYTPQPQRAITGVSRRSQSFEQLDDPTIYSEIPSFTSGHSISPLTNSYSSQMVSNPTPPPPIGYNSAPPPPPPPVHKAAQFSIPQNEAEIHPEGPSPPPTSAMTENISPVSHHSGIDWHSDLKEKLRKRAESVGNCSPKRPATPEDMYVDVVPPSYVGQLAQHRSLLLSSPPPGATSSTNQGRFSMTPPVTPPMKRSEPHVPPQRPPKPNKASISSYDEQDEDDNSNDSPLAKALKAAKLKKIVSNDRSAPKV